MESKKDKQDRPKKHEPSLLTMSLIFCWLGFGLGFLAKHSNPSLSILGAIGAFATALIVGIGVIVYGYLRNKEYKQEWEKRKKGFALAVEDQMSGHLVGYCECDWNWDPHCPSLSVVIAPADKRQGFGLAVVGLLLSYLFEQTPAHNVNGWIDGWNTEALAFAEAMGFQRTGTVPRVGMKNGRYVDGVLVDILRSEWGEGGVKRGA